MSTSSSLSAGRDASSSRFWSGFPLRSVCRSEASRISSKVLTGSISPSSCLSLLCSGRPVFRCSRAAPDHPASAGARPRSRGSSAESDSAAPPPSESFATIRAAEAWPLSQDSPRCVRDGARRSTHFLRPIFFTRATSPGFGPKVRRSNACRICWSFEIFFWKSLACRLSLFGLFRRLAEGQPRQSQDGD